MNIKKKIINYIFELNTENFKKQKDKQDFYEYITNVINNSHFSVKFLYYIFITKIIFFYFIFLPFFFNKKLEKKFFKLVLRFSEKIFILKNIFKFLKIYSIIYYYG